MDQMATLEHNISKLEHIALKLVQKVQQAESEKAELNERLAGIVSLFENAGLTDAAPAENELNSLDNPSGGLLDFQPIEGADGQ